MKRFYRATGFTLATLLPSWAMAADSTINSGDTAWILTSSLLVLFMTLPGLALFYGGMVRSKNILSVMMQCFAITGLISLLWVLYGYSLAFDSEGMSAGVVSLNSFIGGLGKLGLTGITPQSLFGSIPEALFVLFQMTFAIITPALIVGAFAERMKFSAMLCFSGLWFTLVYLPIAHMVWGGAGSLMGDWGVLDFAGGTVVHINAGVAGLVACLVLGKRLGYPNTPMAPHNLGYTLMGAAMLWIGWFGFNAGSALMANGTAAMAMLVTQIATAAAALSWMTAEWLTHGKPSALGVASGVVAGLVAVTPAAGTCGPLGAMVIGLVSGALCFFMATSLKRKLGYDDSLDAFGVHGVGGIVGALLTGVFAAPSLGGFGSVTDLAGQLFIQFKGVAVTVVYCAIVTWLILKVLNALLGLRVSDEAEAQGLDLAEHNERGYNL